MLGNEGVRINEKWRYIPTAISHKWTAAYYMYTGCLKKDNFSIGNIFVNPEDTAKPNILLDT